MKKINEFQEWLVAFYKERDWYDYNPYIRMGFLIEELGELSSAIRTVEIGRDRPDQPTRTKEENFDNLVEEMADVFSNLLILADKYDISVETMMQHNKNKLTERFKTNDNE